LFSISITVSFVNRLAFKAVQEFAHLGSEVVVARGGVAKAAESLNHACFKLIMNATVGAHAIAGVRCATSGCIGTDGTRVEIESSPLASIVCFNRLQRRINISTEELAVGSPGDTQPPEGNNFFRFNGMTHNRSGGHCDKCRSSEKDDQ